MKDKQGSEWIVQANEMAVFEVKKSLTGLSLTDRRLMSLLVSKIDPYMDQDSDFPLMEVVVSDFQRINNLKVGGGKSYQVLRESVLNLMTTVIEFPDRSNPGKMKMAQLLTEGEYVKGEGWIKLRLHPSLKPVYTQLKSEFFKYRLEMLGRIKSVYALRLYEYLKSKEGLKHKMISLSVDDLRKILSVEDGKLQRFSDLKRRALDPAVNTVKNHTDMWCEYSLTRRGRGGGVTGIVLNYKTQKPVTETRANVTGFDALTNDEKLAFWDWIRARKPELPTVPDWKFLGNANLKRYFKYYEEDRNQGKLFDRN